MKKLIKIGCQFSGVGAFDFALDRLGIEYENVYQAEWDKFARQTYLHNHSEPVYYVNDVHDTPTEEITEKYGSLDIAMFSPPCQAFSLAGKRKGEDDDRGVLFYNSHEFIQKNKPRYFIFENVKGLLSDDAGKTFQRWVDLLGGKSVNGNPVIFPHEGSTPYHIYYQVLNAKHFGVPQNRERIFIIGIRDDEDNNFTFPKPFELEKRLKDVLETNVDEKYFLSDKMVDSFINSNFTQEQNRLQEKQYCDTLLSRDYKSPKLVKVGYINQDTQASVVFCENSISPTLCAGTHGYANGYVQTKVVGDLPGKHEQNSRVYGIDGISPTLTTMQGGGQDPKIAHSYKIRKLTPRECFSLMDFPDSFTWPVSDSQAYKQAGNSIVVNVLAQIINKLNF